MHQRNFFDDEWNDVKFDVTSHVKTTAEAQPC